MKTLWIRCGFCGIEHGIECEIVNGEIRLRLRKDATATEVCVIQSDSIIERGDNDEGATHRGDAG